jgi:hypothetical protein
VPAGEKEPLGEGGSPLVNGEGWIANMLAVRRAELEFDRPRLGLDGYPGKSPE